MGHQVITGSGSRGRGPEVSHGGHHVARTCIKLAGKHGGGDEGRKGRKMMKDSEEKVDCVKRWRMVSEHEVRR